MSVSDAFHCKMTSDHQGYQSRAAMISHIHLQDAAGTRVRYSQAKDASIVKMRRPPGLSATQMGWQEVQV